MNLRRLITTTFLILLLPVGAIACAGGSHAKSIPPVASGKESPQDPINSQDDPLQPSEAPGHGSPQAATAGFVAAAAKNEGSNVCAYVLPAQVSECNQWFTTNALSIGGWSFGKSFAYGDQALVVLIADKFCSGGVCASNSDPNKDLPQTEQEFSAAFAHAKGNPNSPAVPCVRINGQWYVILY